jgi:hypothetical protein
LTETARRQGRRETMEGASVKKILGVAMVALLAACGGGNKPEMSNQVLHANGPDWVNRGTGAYGGDKGKVFYGVGIASGIRNAAMRRSTSDSRARAEIAKILDTYVAVLNKDYMASTTAGDMSASSEEQHVEQALKTYSQMELSGVQIIDHWVDTDGTEYALASLEMDTFKNNIDKMKELNAKVRDAVRANADKAFDELSAEEAKHQK